MGQSQQTAEVSATLSQFVYELLDAHDDTMRLAEELTGDLSWDVASGLLAATAARRPRAAGRSTTL